MKEQLATPEESGKIKERVPHRMNASTIKPMRMPGTAAVGPNKLPIIAASSLPRALNDFWYLKPTERNGRGWGATQAIRGALCHWVELHDGKIKNYQIIAPTTWNVGPRTEEGVRGPMEEAFIGAPIVDPSDPVEIGHVARSYDSCLVCTVHAYDARTGKELARFKTR
jgi:hypothetical protein